MDSKEMRARLDATAFLRGNDALVALDALYMEVFGRSPINDSLARPVTAGELRRMMADYAYESWQLECMGALGELALPNVVEGHTVWFMTSNFSQGLGSAESVT